MEIKLIGQCTILQSVRLEDASFISRLRSNPLNNQYLSSTRALTEREQLNWINNYLDQKDGFYFTIENLFTGKKNGTISLYNYKKDKQVAEFGRYISESPVNAIEAEYLILKFAFEVMNLRFVYCRTMKSNIKVWKQHKEFGFVDICFEEFQGLSNNLLKQEISLERYLEFNYSHILNLINRFKK